ncbi:MAG: replicative DNA helicase [Solobacterium sp.]|nr:replicative DNA helicase [Solobacterium sp.]
MPVAALPSAVEAEGALLGTMLVYTGASRIAIEEGLSEDDFYNEQYRMIFHAVESLSLDSITVDPVSVTTRLQDQGNFEKIGGNAMLVQLMASAVTSANTKAYVTILKEKALTRAMIEAGRTIAAAGMEGVENVDDYLDESEKSVLNVSRSRQAGEFHTTPELMNEVIDQIHRLSVQKTDVVGVRTGFTDLDHTTHGFQRGDLIILAARPSMGKTAVALNLAMNVAGYQNNEAVAIFSLEMSAESLAMRLLSAKSRVAGDSLRTGRNLDNEKWNRISEASDTLSNVKIFIDDKSSVKVSEIFSKCRRLKNEHGLALVLIDYIQLIQGSSSGRSEVNRQQEVSEISRSLKSLARELDVPVIALSQLSRNVESREDKKPQLSDLRESGAIEQDADIVMLLFRKSYYDSDAKEEAERTGSEELEINIAKHRNGATRRINLAFEANTNALMNIERHAE